MHRYFYLAALTLAPCLLAEMKPYQGTRPRIFTSAENITRLRTMASDTQRNSLGYVPAEGWKAIKARADYFVTAPPYHRAVTIPGRGGRKGSRWEYTLSKTPPSRHDDSPYYPPWTAMFQEKRDSITTRLKYLLVAHLVTDDMKYFERAKKIVMALCAWPGIWTDPSLGKGEPCLDTGHAATWVAIFYDWCHDRLTLEERGVVRQALVEKALVPIDGMINSLKPYHNYTAVLGCGLGIGGIALLGEDKRAESWIRHAVDRTRLYFDCQGKDGGAFEGPNYGDYASKALADLIWALLTAKVPNQLMGHPFVNTLSRYCISLLNPNSCEQPTFGDGGPSRGFSRLMLVMAMSGSSDAGWYCRKIGALNPVTPRAFLAVDAALLNAKQPDTNPSDCFIDVGYAILRDGHKSGTGFLAFKAGPPHQNVTHNHYDQNSFQINYAGTWIAADPGYRSYFNPARKRYTVGTLGHNTIVLDLDDDYLKSTRVASAGHDQVHLTKGRIREFFTSDEFDYVLGAAAEAYNPVGQCVLKRFDRQIIFVKPNLFFIRDTLSAPAEHAYSFLLHLPRGGEFQISADKSSALGIYDRCRMQIHTSSPAGISMHTSTYPGAESYGPYLAATTGKTSSTTITSVLVPLPNQGQLILNPGFEKGMTGWLPQKSSGHLKNHVIDTKEKHSGKASARIDDNGYYYSPEFSLPPGTRITARWWAKCSADKGTRSSFCYWKVGNEYFGRTRGPSATENKWKQYELATTIPEGVHKVSLGLEFFGRGQCWYDDIEFAIAAEEPDSSPAVITPLQDGAAGLVCEKDGMTHLFLCGRAGHSRVIEAAGHTIVTDAEIALVSLGAQEPALFTVGGKALSIDGKYLNAVSGMWRMKRE